MRALNRIFGMGPKRETRARESFTDQQIVLISAAARGSDDVATACSAVEVAAGMYARDLSLAEVTPRNSRTVSITPSWLALAGRELARSGQFVCDIQIVSGKVGATAGRVRLRGAGERRPVIVDLDFEYVRSWVRPHSLPTERWDCEHCHRPHGVAALGWSRTMAKRVPHGRNVERYRTPVAR